MSDDTDLPETPDTADDDTDAPEPPDIDQEKAKELKRKTKQAREEAQQQHNEMLEAVAEGEDWSVEDYEWVELGGVELKVKTWLPGDVMDRMGAVGEMAQSNDPTAATDAIRANVESLTTQTEVIRSDSGAEFDTNANIREFWQNYVSKWGNKGLERALETVLEPVEAEQDRQEEALESFRGDKNGPRDRSPSEWRS